MGIWFRDDRGVFEKGRGVFEEGESRRDCAELSQVARGVDINVRATIRDAADQRAAHDTFPKNLSGGLRSGWIRCGWGARSD